MRSKLVAVVLIPTVGFLALAGLNLGAVLLDARAYEFDARVAELDRQVTDLVHELQAERDLTPAAMLVEDESSSTALAGQQRDVDRAVKAYRGAASRLSGDAGPELAQTMNVIDDDLRALPRLRDAVRGTGVTLPAAFDEYSAYIEHLLQVTRGLTEAKTDPDLALAVQALEEFSQAKERSSQSRGVVYEIALRPDFQSDDRETLGDVLAHEQAAMAQFTSVASEREKSLVSGAMRSQAALTVSRLQATARRAATGGAFDVDAEQWFAASSSRIEQMRQAESRLLRHVIDRSKILGADAVSEAIITGTSIVTVLFFTVLLSLYIARTMARQLSHLRTGALDVAQVHLPETVDRLRRDARAPDRPSDVIPVGVHSPDEVGQLAAAFDAVHRQALWLATEQAVLRHDVNQMFVNFSRRSQSLVERQLQLIDELEAREQSPDALENLFRLDHLATRMRRNNESLLVIAGSETTRRWAAPVPLPDVVLAAVSEIEQFTRVSQRTDADIAVRGHVVSDIVHLLAELLENATRSSSPQTGVVVTGRWTRGGSEALLEIEDRGVGLTKRDLAAANRRLSGQPDARVPATAQLGLFVVSRLARRHGISVSLSESQHGGVVAGVWLPSNLVSPVVDADTPTTAPTNGESQPPSLPAHPSSPVPDTSARTGSTPARQGGPAQRPPAGIPAAGDTSAPAVRPTTGEVPTTHKGLPRRERRAHPESAPTGSEPVHPEPVRSDASGSEPPRETTHHQPSRAEATHLAPADHEFPRTEPANPYPMRMEPARPEWVPSEPPRNGTAPTSEPADTQPARSQPAWTQAAHTEPTHSEPAARDEPRPEAQEEPVVLSVFDSVSEWFRSQVPAAGPASEGTAAGNSDAVARDAVARDTTRPQATLGSQRNGVGSWTSASDKGWAAAEEAQEPVTDGVTGAGLPIRKPMAHFVPGSTEHAQPGETGSAATQPYLPDRDEPTAPGAAAPGSGPGAPSGSDIAALGMSRPSPERVRGMLSKYYRGVREAREAHAGNDDESRPPRRAQGAPDGFASQAPDPGSSSRTGDTSDKQERT